MPQLLPPQHVRNVQKANAAANDALLHISALDELAQVYPDIRERVDELKARQQLLSDVSTKALQIHRRMSTQDG